MRADARRSANKLPGPPERQMILVIDRCPARRYGIFVTLTDAGFAVETPRTAADSPDTCDVDHPLRAIVCVAGLADADAVRRLHTRWPRVPLVVLLGDNSYGGYQMMLDRGASAVLPADVELTELVQATASAINGLVVLHRSGAGAGDDSPASRLALADQEIGWLKALAAGVTVEALAREAGYSERSMYRQLGLIYKRLNARNRMQALLVANSHGMLT
jgi:DNA-binding NarL/FixJ family response regulator